jgi:hypothetical protein
MTTCPAHAELNAQKVKDTLEKHYHDQRPLPSQDGRHSHVFEIGLCLAGAVSAGAYTAGALDFLIEALDAWYRAKHDSTALGGRDPSVPQHDVVASVITGASAGGASTMIVAKALPYAFPPVRSKIPLNGDTGNPLYDTWVRGIDFRDLMRTDDIDGGGRLMSLLDCSVLDRIRHQLLLYGRDEMVPRSYFANPLRLIFSVGNLRGARYRMPLAGGSGLGHDMLIHGDYMRFALEVAEGYDWKRDKDLPRPDEIPLRLTGHAGSGPADSDAWDNWQRLVDTALASGAVPFALAPRRLARCTSDYYFRRVVVPGADHAPKAVPVAPAFGESFSDRYEFVSVDGGTFDNEPLEQTRIELAGPTGRNPREWRKARRATILIDPFSDPVTLGPREPLRMLTETEEHARESLPDGEREKAAKRDTDRARFGRLAAALFSAYKEHSRAKPADLALALDDHTYSRYLIAPARKGRRGAAALTSGALGAFLGFVSIDYRHHDYMLGRRNCQQFLRRHFTLPVGHPLFENTWSSEARERWQRREVEEVNPDTGTREHRRYYEKELPIIPLMEDVDLPIDVPDWPKGKAGVDELRPMIQKRVTAVVDRLTNDLGISVWFRPLVYMAKRWIVQKVQGGAEGALARAIQDVEERAG